MKHTFTLIVSMFFVAVNAQADGKKLPFIGSHQAADFVCYDYYGDVPNDPIWGVGNPVHCTSEHIFGICSIPKRKSLDGSSNFGGHGKYRWDEFYMNAFIEFEGEGAWLIKTEEELASFRETSQFFCENYPGKPGVWTNVPYTLPPQ